MWIDFSISSISISNSMEVTEVDTIKGCTALDWGLTLQQKLCFSHEPDERKNETCAKKLGKA
jgi:hypothetical protein